MEFNKVNFPWCILYKILEIVKATMLGNVAPTNFSCVHNMQPKSKKDKVQLQFNVLNDSYHLTELFM